MQFETHDGVIFNIPAAWWESAAMTSFKRKACSDSYNVAHGEVYELAPLSEIVTPKRKPGLRDFSDSGLQQERMVKILNAFVLDVPLPPVKVSKVIETLGGAIRYNVYDGFHRYYGSIAAGFSQLPITIVPIQQVKNLLNEEAASGAVTEHL